MINKDSQFRVEVLNSGNVHYLFPEDTFSLVTTSGDRVLMSFGESEYGWGCKVLEAHEEGE